MTNAPNISPKFSTRPVQADTNRSQILSFVKLPGEPLAAFNHMCQWFFTGTFSGVLGVIVPSVFQICIGLCWVLCLGIMCYMVTGKQATVTDLLLTVLSIAAGLAVGVY
jgi:hypothetical protein